MAVGVVVGVLVLVEVGLGPGWSGLQGRPVESEGLGREGVGREVRRRW